MPQNRQEQVDEPKTTARGADGKFVKGRSGNPGGRPSALAELRELAQQYGPAAVKRLAELMDDEDGRVAVAACNSLLDRAYGKPVQAIEGTADGPPIKLDGASARNEIASLLARLAARSDEGEGTSEPQ